MGTPISTPNKVSNLFSAKNFCGWNEKRIAVINRYLFGLAFFLKKYRSFKNEYNESYTRVDYE